jgi:hypothetical protein
METLMGAGVTPMQGDTNPLNAALSRAASRKDAGASSVKTRAAATTDGGESEELEAVVTALKVRDLIASTIIDSAGGMECVCGRPVDPHLMRWLLVGPRVCLLRAAVTFQLLKMGQNNPLFNERYFLTTA